MARSFAITTTATDTVRTDAQGHAEAVFTVTNTASRPMRGLAKVKALGDTKREWLSIEGETERDFAAGATQQFTLNFDARAETAAPATAAAAAPGTAAGSAQSTSGVQPGIYKARIDISSASDADENFTEGPVVTFEVPAITAPPKPSFPLWIIFVILGALIVGSLVIFLLLRGRGSDETNDNEVVEAPTPGVTPSPAISPSPVSPSPLPVEPYQASWVNKDPNTRSITRLEIKRSGNELQVHAWGKCHPSDCDWGIVNGSILGDHGRVIWNQGFVTRTMDIYPQGGELRVVTDSVYTDTRPRRVDTEFFVRQ